MLCGHLKADVQLTTGMLKRDVEAASILESWPPPGRSCCCRVGGMSEEKVKDGSFAAAAVAKRVVGLGRKLAMYSSEKAWPVRSRIFVEKISRN